jgi:hypothetical protein
MDRRWLLAVEIVCWAVVALGAAVLAHAVGLW